MRKNPHIECHNFSVWSRKCCFFLLRTNENLSRINSIETIKTTEKNNKPISLFIEKINKMNKPGQSSKTNRKKKRQITNIGNESGFITSDSKRILENFKSMFIILITYMKLTNSLKAINSQRLLQKKK